MTEQFKANMLANAIVFTSDMLNKTIPVILCIEVYNRFDDTNTTYKILGKVLVTSINDSSTTCLFSEYKGSEFMTTIVLFSSKFSITTNLATTTTAYFESL